MKKNIFIPIIGSILYLLCMAGCKTDDLAERIDFIKNQQWSNSQLVHYTFNIEDTSTNYLLYFTFRHFNAYHYKNVWIQITHISPNNINNEVKYEIPLAKDDEGWLGEGMYDIYYHKVLLDKKPFHFQKGKHQFIIKHIMRENPLQYVLNCGFRIEKTQ